MLESDSDEIYESVRDSGRGDFSREHRARTFVVGENNSVKPPLPSQRNVPRSKKPSGGRNSYSQSKKMPKRANSAAEDITSISEDLKTDSRSLANPVQYTQPNNVRHNSRRLHRRSSGRSNDERASSSFDGHLPNRSSTRRRESSRRHSHSEVSDSGIIPNMQDTADTSLADSETQNLNLVEQLQHLIAQYQQKIVHKDEKLEMFEIEISHLTGRLEDAEVEIARLQSHLQEREISSPMTSSEWHLLKEQAGLVLEENQFLTQQLEQLQLKMRENHIAYKSQMSLLRDALDATADDKAVSQQELEHLRERFERLRDEYNVTRLQISDHISKEDHSVAVRECKRLLENLKSKYVDETHSLASKLKATQKENATFSLQMSNYSRENEQLIAENKVLITTHSKMLKQLQRSKKISIKSKMEKDCLKLKMEFLQNQVEKLSEERKKCVSMASCFYNQANDLILRLDDAHLNREKFQHLQAIKIKLMQKWEDETSRLRLEERAYSRQKREYERVLRRLRRAQKIDKLAASQQP